MPQKPTYPGFTPDDEETDLSGFTPDEPTQKDPESFLQSYSPEWAKPFVGWAERPLTDIGTRIGQNLGEPIMKYAESKDAPDWSRYPLLAAGQFTKNFGEGVSGLTSPLNLATAGVLGRASSLAEAGQISQARNLAKVGKALTLPMIAEGGHQVYAGKTWDEKLQGVPGLALGYFGMRSPLPTGENIPKSNAPINVPWDESGPSSGGTPPTPPEITPLLERLRTSLDADAARRQAAESQKPTAQDYPEGQNPLLQEYYNRQKQNQPTPSPDIPPASPDFIQQVDPNTDPFASNASGESMASQEAINRQQSMQGQGKQFVVIDRAGNVRPLIGPEAVDYNPRPGETYGIMAPEGFQVLTDNGGRYSVGVKAPNQPEINEPAGVHDLGDIGGNIDLNNIDFGESHPPIPPASPEFGQQVTGEPEPIPFNPNAPDYGVHTVGGVELPSTQQMTDNMIEMIKKNRGIQPGDMDVMSQPPAGHELNARNITPEEFGQEVAPPEDIFQTPPQLGPTNRQMGSPPEPIIQPEVTPEYQGGHEFQPDIPMVDEQVHGGTSRRILDPNGPLEVHPGPNGEATLPNPTPEHISSMENEGYTVDRTNPDGSVTMRKQTPREQVTTNPTLRQRWSEGIQAFLRDESGELRFGREDDDRPIEHDPNLPGLQYHFRGNNQYVTHAQLPGRIEGPFTNDAAGHMPSIEAGMRLLDEAHNQRRSSQPPSNIPPSADPELDELFSSPAMQEPIQLQPGSTTGTRDIRYDPSSESYFDRNLPNWEDVNDATPEEMNRARGIVEGTIPDPTPYEATPYTSASTGSGWQSIDTSTPESNIPVKKPNFRGKAPKRATLEKLFGKEILADLENNPIQHDKIPVGSAAGQYGRKTERKVNPAHIATWSKFADEQVSKIPVDPSKPGLTVTNPYGKGYGLDNYFEIHYRNKDGIPVGVIKTNSEGTGISILGIKSELSGLGRGRILARMFEEAGKRGIRAAHGGTSAFTDNILQQIMRGLKNFSQNEEGHLDLQVFADYIDRILGRGKNKNPNEVTPDNPTLEDIRRLREQGYEETAPDSGVYRKTGRGGPIVLEQDIPNRTPGKKGPKEQEEIGKVRQYYDLARGVMSVDPPWVTSAAFRQAAPWAGTKNWFKAFGKAASSFNSEEGYNAMMANMMDSPLFRPRKNPLTGKPDISFAQEIGLRMTDVNMSRTARQEGIRAQLAERIPIAGRYIKASNRAFSGFLNYLRFSQLEAIVRDGQIMAKAHNDPTLDITRNLSLAKEVATFLNDTTGSGKLETGFGKHQYNVEKHASALADVFFSPRLMASRIRMLNPSTYIMASKPVRQMYLHAMLRSVGMWWGLAQLGKMAGGEVNTDPKNPDFGKVKFGNTRLDPGAGFQQYLVLAARNVSGEYSSSTTGNTRTFGEGYNTPTRTTNNIDFLANKLHPVAKLMWDIGNANEHQPVYMMDRVAEMYLPMMTGDLMELAKSDPSLIPLVGAFSGVGGGSQTYTGEPTTPAIIPENFPGNYKWTGGKIWPN